jgi:hypothetical protein
MSKLGSVFLDEDQQKELHTTLDIWKAQYHKKIMDDFEKKDLSSHLSTEEAAKITLIAGSDFIVLSREDLKL